jgi:hypothetical protein
MRLWLSAQLHAQESTSMTDAAELLRALMEQQRETTAERKAHLQSLLVEARAALVANGADPMALRVLESLAIERALLDALEANTDRLLRAVHDAVEGG